MLGFGRRKLATVSAIFFFTLRGCVVALLYSPLDSALSHVLSLPTCLDKTTFWPVAVAQADSSGRRGAAQQGLVLGRI